MSDIDLEIARKLKRIDAELDVLRTLEIPTAGGGPGFAHAILSASHVDSTAAAAVQGDVIRAEGTTPPLWTRYPIGTHWQLFGVNAGQDEPEWQSFDWDFHVVAAGGDGVHDHSSNPEGGVLPAAAPAAHDIIGALHTYTGGAALDVFGLSAPNTLALLTPSAAPGVASAILKSDAGGGLTLAGALGCGSPFTITNPTGPSSLTASVAPTTGIVTLTAAGTTPGVQFVNHVGIGSDTTALNANRVLTLLETTTSTTANQICFYSVIRANPAGATVRGYYGGYIGAYSLTGCVQNFTRPGGALIGLYGEVGHVGSGTVTLSYSHGASFLTTGGGVVTEHQFFKVITPTMTSGSVGTFVGLEIPDLTAATTNFAIRTNAGNVVFNEGGNASTIFRVEGDTDANLICTDAANNRLGIGMSAPLYKLDVTGNLRCSTGFGCNGMTPQTAYVVGAAATDLASVVALANNLRTALINNGIAVNA